MKRKLAQMIIWLALSLVLLPVSALSDTHNWNGTVSYYWNVAGNWSPAAIPGIDDKAIINNGDVVTLTSNPAYIHQLEVGSTSALNIGYSASAGATLWFNSSLTDHYILNEGVIRVGLSGYLGYLNCGGKTVLLQGNGTLILGGLNPGNSLTTQGGIFINTAGHTIRGGGKILALANQGQVIADNGTLWIQCTVPVDNTGGTMSASGSSSVLRIHATTVANGQIIPQDGKVVLTGGAIDNVALGPGAVEIGADDSLGWGSTFLNTVTLASGTTVTVREDSSLWGDPSGNSTTLVNNGAIFMASTGGMPTYLCGNLTLQGPGTLTMGGGPGNVADGTGYNLINSAPHLIQGSGSITSIVNNGAIIANNGTLTMSGVTGTGMVDVANDATLSVTPLTLQTGYLTMAPQANLSVNIVSGDNFIDLKGNLVFFQIDPTKWNWGTSGLNMSGGTWIGAPQTLEVGCRDDGAAASGYTNNFVLPYLGIASPNTYVSLVDHIDNGHRAGGREALYVTTLQVTSGATLNLNGIKLYAMRSGTVYRVKSGEGSLYGGGKIIDTAAGGPGTKLLLLLQ